MRDQNEVIRERVRGAYGQESVVASPNLGCGNPTALAALRPGEVVVDLGSGAGFDALQAAPQLGEDGRFIGVDMTPAMLARARTNAVNAGLARTVEFREGVIEDLPIASNSVDVVISNCVVNLSPDKPAVFREVYRVLKPGGRVAISDIVLGGPLPEEVKGVDAGYFACVTGALTIEAYRAQLADAGFTDVKVDPKPIGCVLEAAKDDPFLRELFETLGPARVLELAAAVFSANIEARKPT